MNSFEALRKEIDDLNAQLLCILDRRAELVELLLVEKQRIGLEVYDAKREKDQLDKIKKSSSGKYTDQALEKIFTAIFDVSKEMQYLKGLDS